CMQKINVAKALWVLVSLCLGLALACSRQEKAGAEAEPGAGDDKIVVGFSQTGAESSWRIAHTESIKKEAEKRGVELVFADGQNVHNNQINAVNGFITRGVDVIVIAPQESIGWK